MRIIPATLAISRATSFIRQHPRSLIRFAHSPARSFSAHIASRLCYCSATHRRFFPPRFHFVLRKHRINKKMHVHFCIVSKTQKVDYINITEYVRWKLRWNFHWELHWKLHWKLHQSIHYSVKSCVNYTSSVVSSVKFFQHVYSFYTWKNFFPDSIGIKSYEIMKKNQIPKFYFHYNFHNIVYHQIERVLIFYSLMIQLK